MVKKQAALQAFGKTVLVALASAAMLAACAPGQTPTQVQEQVETSVALTVEAQGQMGTAVAQTLVAQAPQATATSSPTAIALDLPTPIPALATVTPFVVVPSGGGGGSGNAPLYGCSVREVKPKFNQFKPGDPIDVVWVITNTGTKTWPSKKDLDLVNSTVISSFTGTELPALKSGDTATVSFEANAPDQPGFYGMQFKVEGGLCFPALNIQVMKAPDP